MLAPESPYVNWAGNTNAVVSNHLSMVGLSSRPEPTRLGRCAPTPVLARSAEMVGVYGRPLRQMAMACICHPPSSAWAAPPALPRKRFPRPTGSSQPTLMARLCGTSKLEIAFSRPALPPTDGLSWVVMLLENV